MQDRVRQEHPEVLSSLVAEIRRRNYSIRTEQAYQGWVCRFIAFSDHRDPRILGAAEVVSFLEYLAVRNKVAASTQNQALNALVFLYGQVLDRPLDELGNFVRAKRPKRLPVVLTRDEVNRLLNLETAVGRGAECVIFFAWQGTTTSNSRPIARSCNAARRKIGRALRPVAASP